MVSVVSPQVMSFNPDACPVLTSKTHIENHFPDLAEFMRKNKLEKHMRFFDHQLKLDPLTLEPLLLVKGNLIPWSKAKDLIFGPVLPSSLSLPHGWKYNDQGIVDKNLIKWTKLEPDWKDKTNPIPGHFFIELMCVKKNMWHCWVRLIDDQTQVISTGLCGKVTAWLPLKRRKGKLASPDPGEFIRADKMSTRFEISAEQYAKLKAKIENDQTKPISFHLMKRNCAVYALELLKEIGIQVDNREYPAQALLRSALSNLNVKPPEKAMIALHYVAHFFRTLLSPLYNLLLLPLGGEFALTPSSLKFATGWKVHAWQEKVAEWRQEQLRAIQQEKQEKAFITPEEEQAFERRIFEATYGIPPVEFLPTTTRFSTANPHQRT